MCSPSVVGLCAGPAWGYVREVTKSGVPIAWRAPCVDLHVFVGSAPEPVDWDLLTATTQSAAAWSYPQVSGTDIRLAVVLRPEASAGVGHDHQNVIVFRATTWCREPAPKDDAGVPEPECYPANVLAVTSLFKNAKTGELLDTDIEFNAVNYTWGDLVAQPQPAAANTADFQNALTHELGHVVGLDHNCYAPNDGQPRQSDNTGVPAVDCYGATALPETVAQATMYPSVVLTDTTRRTLSPDDELGVSDVPPPTRGLSVTGGRLQGGAGHPRDAIVAEDGRPLQHGVARRPGALATTKAPAPRRQGDARCLSRHGWRSGSSVSRWRAAIWGARTWSRGPRNPDRWSARSRVRTPPM